MRQLREETEKLTEASDNQNTALADRIRELDQEIQIAEKRIQFGDLEADILAEQLDLKNRAVKLDDDGNEALRERLTTLNRIQKAEEQREEAQERQVAQARELQFLARRIDLTRQYQEAEDDLARLLEARPDLYREIQRAAEDLRLRELDAATDLASGFERAGIRIRREAEDFASVAEASVEAFVSNMEDLFFQLGKVTGEFFVDFAKTGKANFEDLGKAAEDIAKEIARTFLEELARIIVRLLVVQALSTFLPGAAPPPVLPSSAAPFPQFADGGTTQPDRSYIVGERGPEVFTPNQTGSVAPIINAPPAPAPNIAVVTVQSMEEVGDAIAAGDFDDVIINRLGQHPDKVRRITQ